MKIYRILIPLIMLSALIFAGAYCCYPRARAEAVYREMAARAGVVKREVSLDGYIVHYYESESGSGETLLLLHGLGGDKTSFLESAVTLKDKFHLIFPDLAGHGDNGRRAGIDYSINGQAGFLRRFADAKGLGSFNLGGNSMGGHVAAAFAVMYPRMVKSLVLINSAGITTGGNHAYTGYGGPIGSMDELRSAMSFAYSHVPAISFTESLYMMRKHNSSRDFIAGTVIPGIRNGKYFDLTEYLGRIKAPTIIIWGADDRVITLSVAEKFHGLIKGSRLVVIEKTSHCPQLEKPEEVAEEIIHYITTE